MSKFISFSRVVAEVNRWSIRERYITSNIEHHEGKKVAQDNSMCVAWCEVYIQHFNIKSTTPIDTL